MLFQHLLVFRSIVPVTEIGRKSVFENRCGSHLIHECHPFPAWILPSQYHLRYESCQSRTKLKIKIKRTTNAS